MSTAIPDPNQNLLSTSQTQDTNRSVPIYIPNASARSAPDSNSSTAVIDIEDAIREKLRVPVQPNEATVVVDRRNVGSTNDKSLLSPPPVASIWGVQYHAIDMQRTLDYIEYIVERRIPSYLVTANLNYAMLCRKIPRLVEFTKKAALVVCDGMPIYWRSQLGPQKLPARVAGSDLIYELANRCAKKNLSLYLYGAAEGVAVKAAERLCQLNPGLRIAGVQSPPFHASSSAEIQASLNKIKQAKPDILLVALGQPKGEYWIEEHLAELGVPLSIQLGASFDFVAGTAVRAPRLWQKLGMEWLYRLLRDPKRLGPRYFNNFVFLIKAIRRELIEKLS